MNRRHSRRAERAVMGPPLDPLLPSTASPPHPPPCTRGSIQCEARVDSLTLASTECREASNRRARGAGEELGVLGCHGAEGGEECAAGAGGEAAHGVEGAGRSKQEGRRLAKAGSNLSEWTRPQRSWALPGSLSRWLDAQCSHGTPVRSSAQSLRSHELTTTIPARYSDELVCTSCACTRPCK
jgi:hypothetical protein